MKSHLLLFFSIMLLLLSLQKSSKYNFADARQVVLVKSCSYAHPGIKKPCAKKCIRHQTHSQSKGAATVVVDCGQQLYAVVHTLEIATSYNSATAQTVKVSNAPQHLSPYLETEHAPPRLS